MGKLFTAAALEAIMYQTADTFPIKLYELVSQILIEDYKTNKTLLVKSPYVTEMMSLIRSKFNINIIIDPVLSDYVEAAIISATEPNLYDINRISKAQAVDIGKILKQHLSKNDVTKAKEITNRYQRENTKIPESIHDKKGSIDLKNAKVDGYFSTLKHRLLINFHLLKEYGLTADEITAIILHEIGHAFHGMESRHLLESNNATIAQIVKEINNNDLDKAEYIFKTKFASKEEFDIYLNNKNTKLDLASHVATVYVGRINTQMVNNTYDQVNSENLADEFVSRFGYGVHVVTALQKMHKNSNIITTSRILYIAGIIVIALSFIIDLALLGIFGVIICAVIFILLFSAEKKGMLYDFPAERYTRVRNSIINNLKNLKLPPEITKNLIYQIEVIDTVIAETHYFKGVPEMLHDNITPWGRSDHYYMRLQQEIETGLNNALFISAARVKTT